jgi:hypothetical protein
VVIEPPRVARAKIGVASLFTLGQQVGNLATVKILPILVGAVVLAGALTTTASASTFGVLPPKVPGDIQPETGNVPFEVGHALGVQIYQCNGTAWTFVEPKAVLVTNRLQIISHFAGPTWQHQDGSSVVGALVKPVTVDAKSIPWLLLSAKTTTAGKFGNRLTSTTFIQRINTRGGLAPAASTCTVANAGARKEVPYTADYYFWRKA